MDDNKSRTPPVTPPPAQREAARRSAQNHFAASEKRDTEVRKEIQRQQAATAAQMTKLRALRLQKEEADRVEAANAPPPVHKTRKKKAV